MWQAVIERFEVQAPGAAMARLALEQALPASWIDAVFQSHRQRQYPRELLFSSVVELMLLVTPGLRPWLHAAVRKLGERLPVSLAALYAKVQRTGPGVLRALVQGSAERLITGRLREQAIELAQAHGGELQGELQGQLHHWRRIELALHTPTGDGDQSIVLWSNLPPEIDAATIARLYRQRWRIKGMFHRLESVLNSEIKTLGHPRAALPGFAVAVMACNVLALPKRFIEQAHHRDHPELDVSTYHLAVDITSDYGMLRMLPPQHWPRPGGMCGNWLTTCCAWPVA